MVVMSACYRMTKSPPPESDWRSFERGTHHEQAGYAHDERCNVRGGGLRVERCHLVLHFLERQRLHGRRAIGPVPVSKRQDAGGNGTHRKLLDDSTHALYRGPLKSEHR